MPIEKAPVTGRVRVGSGFLVMLFLLAAILAVLFRTSFQPDQVLFANDGPLGALNSQADHAISNLFGQWLPLNWVGAPGLGFFPRPTDSLLIALGPVMFAKFHAPLALLALGLCAWFFFRQLGFDWRVCVLGGLAAALNTNALSNSCWGLPVWAMSRACLFLALAAFPHATVRNAWPRAVLAGFAIGLGVMEGFDAGAILSVYGGAYIFFQSLIPAGAVAGRITAGTTRLAVVAACAGLAAAHAISGLVGTQVSGVVGMEQDAETRRARWEGATQWSLPKAEALKVVVPGLYGYRMPQLYGESEGSANGSNYWGGVGRLDGSPSLFRHSGNGEFAGVLVSLLAVWAFAQSFRRKGNVFSDSERKCIWFWAGATLISLLLAFGKHAPFYAIAYQFPYFSTIRNPIKFMHPFHLSVVILFAYGLQGIFRALSSSGAGVSVPAAIGARLKDWWKRAPSFDRKWTVGCFVALIAAGMAWLTYAAARSDLVRHLQAFGFPDETLAGSIAAFSLRQAGLFVLVFALCIGLLTLILSGVFAGQRAKWAWLSLGLVLVTDLVRADAPWIVYWNYEQKYASNPIIDRLREQPHRHRVTARLMPATQVYLAFLITSGRTPQMENFSYLYGSEWLQHHFQYYRIQSLDIIQMPRETEFDGAYFDAFRPATGLFPCGRLWQLTNTGHILGPAVLLDTLNDQFDPGQRRFRIEERFRVAPRQGIVNPTHPDQLTVVPEADGQMALFAFEGALPRAKLFHRWQVETNHTAALERLKSPEFDPSQVVLVSGELPAAGAAPSTNATSGGVEIVRYEPKRIRIEADADSPAVLLLNDRYDGNWEVTVDGSTVELLRCNYLMRGVYLEPGEHTVEFRYRPPLTTCYISFATLIAGVLLCGYLVVARRTTG